MAAVSGKPTLCSKMEKGKEHLETVGKVVPTSETPWEGPQLTLGPSGAVPLCLGSASHSHLDVSQVIRRPAPWTTRTKHIAH